MAWDASQDAEQYRTAHDLQRRLGSRWLVMWGPASRAFWAFYCGSLAVRPLCAPTPQRLLEYIHATESRVAAGVEPHEPTLPRPRSQRPRRGY